MATTKKTTTQKKAAPKRAPAKKTTTKVTRVARPKKAEVRSFRRAVVDEPFFVFRITHQTVYWLILAGIVLLLGLWVIDISDKVQHIYDQIDLESSQVQPHAVKKSN